MLRLGLASARTEGEILRAVISALELADDERLSVVELDATTATLCIHGDEPPATPAAALAARLVRLAAEPGGLAGAAWMQGAELVNADAEEEEEIDEEAALAYLDAVEPPLLVVRRLFRPIPAADPPLELEVLSWALARQLKAQGYAVLDLLEPFFDAEAAAEAGESAKAMASSDGGRFAAAGKDGHDAAVRDDVSAFLSAAELEEEVRARVVLLPFFCCC